MATKKHQVAVEITGDASGVIRETRRAAQEVKAFERQAAATNQRVGRERQANMAHGVVGRGGSMIAGAAGIGGIFGIQKMLDDVRQFENALTDLQITGGKNIAWTNAMRQRILAVSDATGKSKTEVIEYARAIIEQTGNADLATETLASMGDVAVATGAKMGDLGSVMVKLSGSMRVAGKDAQQAFNILRSQEKLGSVTMGNIAQVFGKVASVGGLFGKQGEGLQGVQAMGGLLQLSARGYGMGQHAEAATSAQRFLQRLAMKPEEIEKAFGLKKGTIGTRQKSGAMEFQSLPSIFRSLGEAAAKRPDIAAKQGLKLFELEGFKVLMELSKAAKTGWTNKTGSLGSAASLFGAGSTNEIAADLAARKASVGFKWDQAISRAQNVLHKNMLPVLEKVTEHLPKLAEALKWIFDNSDKLIRLWLGWQGAQMFSRLADASRQMGAGPGGGGMAGTIGRGALGVVGMAGGAATIFGADKIFGKDAPSWQKTGNTIAAGAMMTGNPYAMAGGAAWMAGNALADVFFDVRKKHLDAVEDLKEAAEEHKRYLKRADFINQYGYESRSHAVTQLTSGGVLAHNFQMYREGLKGASMFDRMKAIGAMLGGGGLAGSDVNEWTRSAQSQGLSYQFRLGEGSGMTPEKLQAARGALQAEIDRATNAAREAAGPAGQFLSAEQIAQQVPELKLMQKLLSNIEGVLNSIKRGQDVQRVIAVTTADPGQRAASTGYRSQAAGDTGGKGYGGVETLAGKARGSVGAVLQRQVATKMAGGSRDVTSGK